MNKCIAALWKQLAEVIDMRSESPSARKIGLSVCYVRAYSDVSPASVARSRKLIVCEGERHRINDAPNGRETEKSGQTAVDVAINSTWRSQ